MKKRAAKLLAIVMTLSMVLTACSTTAPPPISDRPAPTPVEPVVGTPVADSNSRPDISGVKQVFNWNLVTEPKTLDPGLNSAVDGSHIIMNLYEGLYRDRGNGFPEPAMAQSVNISPDGLVYTFQLRDANWSDGVPVRAQDFEFSWKRAINPATASEYGYIFDPVKNATLINSSSPNADGTFSDADGNIVLNEEGNPITIDDIGVTAQDDKTLVVTLERPTGYFLDLMDFATYVPLREDVVGDDTTGVWAKDPQRVVSNGPFKLTGYVLGESFTLTKNEFYWNVGGVSLETVNVRFITDSSTALTAFRAGEIDYSEQFPVAEMNALVRAGEVQVFDYIGTYFFVLNTRTEAIDNVDVRHALAKAINRQDIANMRGPGNLPATGFVPFGFLKPNGEDFRAAAGDYGISIIADPQGALELFEKAGYTIIDGKVQDFPRLEILLNSGSNHEEIAQLVQNDLREIGIDVDLRVQEWAVMQDTRRNLDYNGFVRHGWIGDFLDPQTFLEIFLSDSTQSGNGYANPAYDEVTRAGMNATGQERFDNFVKAEGILMDDGYVIPVSYYALPALIAEHFNNFYMKPTGKLWLGDAFMTERR